MPIPALNEDGRLPAGLHDCTLTEIGERFGQFQRTDQRCRLFERLENLIHEARGAGFFRAVIVDGSFVTAEDHPNDIDLILVLLPTHDFDADVRPFEYNVLSKRAIRRRFGFDAVILCEGSETIADAIEFFTRIRGQPDARKGLLRLNL